MSKSNLFHSIFGAFPTHSRKFRGSRGQKGCFGKCHNDPTGRNPVKPEKFTKEDHADFMRKYGHAVK